MKILIIAPLPPPFTGNSLPFMKIIENINIKYEIETINTSKKNKTPFFSVIGRVFFLFKVFYKIYIHNKKFDKVYLSISESHGGNIRDLIIYFICKERLNSFYIHMFGGAAMEKILKPKNTLLYKLNKKYISQFAAVFVEGQFQKNFFKNVISENKIFVVPNFAEDSLFVTQKEISNKFKDTSKLRILFLSNMLYGKGHIELIDAYLAMSESNQKKIKLDFVGEVISQKKLFFSKIKNHENVTYHGPLFGNQKVKLFKSSHIFCLPTYYPYEGQPFSIIEAYASGNVVITTDHSGIIHIFKDGLNGFLVEKKSIHDLTQLITKILRDVKSLEKIALNNLNYCKDKHRETKFIETIKCVLLSP